MRTILAIAAAALLAGCGLTPKQIDALTKNGAAMCHHAEGYGLKTTTVVVGVGEAKLPQAVSTTCEVMPTAVLIQMPGGARPSGMLR